MRLGANEFLQKPFRLLELKNAIQRTQRYLDLQQELSSIKRSYHVLSEELKEEIGHALIVESKSMKKLLGDMNKVAASNNTTVLINGESGTGKELVARGIHSLSKRSEELFYPVNCSAMPDTLVESIVFGHVKGAFTGADKEQKGIFEIANKGTVFLDEIGDMPMAMQSKFLRVLEERKFSRVGSHQRREFDVRILAATNQDLQKLIEQGKFREDLFHRINSFQLEIPALRARPEDINPLLEFFTKYFSQKMKKDIKHIDSRVYRKMHQYDFPGNVRELKNLVERAVILTPGRVLKAELFELGVAVSSDVQDFNLEIQEKRLIKAALEKTDFNKVQAAKLLNLSRQALDRRIKKYNLS
jgi:DNA-binding NtrC family response regulator